MAQRGRHPGRMRRGDRSRGAAAAQVDAAGEPKPHRARGPPAPG
jgi:hypothetical protein